MNPFVDRMGCDSINALNKNYEALEKLEPVKKETFRYPILVI